MYEHGDITGYTHKDGTPDPSDADWDYFDMLAYWFRKDVVRMERVARNSAMYREKWDTHPTYLATTITKVCAARQKVYTGPTTTQDEHTDGHSGGGGGAGDLAPFHVLYDNVHSHTELTVERCTGILSVIREVRRQAHTKDRQGYVIICYETMAERYHRNDRSYAKAVDDMAHNGLLLKDGSTRYKSGNPCIRVKLADNVINGIFPTCTQAKKKGGTPVCPMCDEPGKRIKREYFVCTNPSCVCHGQEKLISESEIDDSQVPIRDSLPQVVDETYFVEQEKAVDSQVPIRDLALDETETEEETNTPPPPPPHCVHSQYQTGTQEEPDPVQPTEYEDPPEQEVVDSALQRYEAAQAADALLAPTRERIQLLQSRYEEAYRVLVKAGRITEYRTPPGLREASTSQQFETVEKYLGIIGNYCTYGNVSKREILLDEMIKRLDEVEKMHLDPWMQPPPKQVKQGKQKKGSR